MRIFGSNAPALVGTAPAARRAASGGFAVNQQEAPKSTAAPAALRTVGGIDALLALQGQDDPAERRRRAVKRGGIALDALDELKLAVLSGNAHPIHAAKAEIRRHRSGGRLRRPPARLVLAEIELRSRSTGKFEQSQRD